MNYYEHHLGDYLRDTAHLSMLEDGAYRRLMDAYYIKEQPLPSELRDVYRLARAASKQDKEAVDVVLREFFTHTAEGWRHKRCDEEIQRYHEGDVERGAKRENAKERQRRSRERRRELFDQLRGHDIVPAYDTPTNELYAQLSRVTSQSVTPPVTRDDTATSVTCDDTGTQHQTPVFTPHSPPRGAGKVAEFPPGFDEFWTAYPRHVAKQDAAKAFAKLRADDALLRRILAALDVAKRSDDWRKDGGRFVPHPATWLNGRRWEDELTPVEVPAWEGAK